jgi:flagellar hook-basal body complex protein FliE
MAIEIAGPLNAYRAAIDRLKDSPGTGAAPTPGGDFSTMVKNFAENAVKVHENAEQQTMLSVTGKTDLNSVVMAVSEAELTLNTVVAVRDRVLEAYREILRMPI